MSVRLIINGNEVYEIDEDCECWKAALEEQALQNKRGCQRQNPQPQQEIRNENHTEGRER